MEEISELKREGLSIQSISQLTGFDRKTIRTYLLRPEGRPVYGPRTAPVSKLEPFKPYLKERLQAGVSYRAQTKGKVESGVKYVRRNLLGGLQSREPSNLADLNAELRRWVSAAAHQRVHERLANRC